MLGHREHGESDRVFTLYTEEFGLVRARCSAVRSENSRMRYALQNYSRSHVGLVRGKRGWRIGGAIPIQGAGIGRGTLAFARITRLIARFTVGEECDPYLFSVLRDAHGVLMQDPCEAWPIIEIVCVARSLNALGYLSVEALDLPAGEAGTTLFTHTMYEDRDILEAETVQEKLLVSINRAIESTHL